VDRQAPLSTIFRDGELSNLIGFDYQTYGADQAASDLVGRLPRHSRTPGSVAPPPLLVDMAPVDGEN